MNKFALFTLPLLGTGVSVGAGYRVYKLAWPKKWFEPKLQWDRLTLEESKKRMNDFKEEIKKSKYEETVPLSAIPMPGENMFWAHSDDADFWNQRSDVLQKNPQFNIPYDIKKLKSWCALRMNTQIYAKYIDGKVKFRSSKDTHFHVESVSQLTDLTDIRNNCSRMITNEEFYKEEQLAKKEDKWAKHNCDSLLKSHYSNFRTGNNFTNCLASPREER